MKHIMLAFVSPISPRYLSDPILYNIQGRPYSSIQTNESAIVYIERMLDGESLSKIFLVATDKVRNELVPTNEFGAISHLEFLQRRLVKECPALEGKFFALDYSDAIDETATLEKNILQIADIADAIIDYAKNFSDREIKIHADMTGGFRHASMMMLSIMQLLKYRGIEIGEVLYSDPGVPIVYRATEIQRMFSLINGADEFVKFGSVNAVYEYFGSAPPEPLSSLLKAMKTFSEAIKICRTSTIESELKNLGRHIQTFREYKDKDVKSELFAKLIVTIETEYGNLLGDGVNRFDIIRWCMRKGFWQQAMTLCTEWLPEEIVDRGICKPKDKSIALDAELDGASFGRGWKQHFIIAYQGEKNGSAREDALKNFCKELRLALKTYDRALLGKKKYGSLKKFAAEYQRARPAFFDLKSGRMKLSEFKRAYPLMTRLFQTIYDERKNALMFNKPFVNFCRTLNYENVFVMLSNLPSERLIELFDIDAEKILSASLEDVEKKQLERKQSERKWANREEMYRALMREGMLCSDIDAEEAIELLHGYYDIRNERNRVNHANSEATKEIGALKKMIDAYLEKLERY